MFPQLIISIARQTLGIFAGCAVLLGIAVGIYGQFDKVIFADEFAGLKNSAFDPALWTAEFGGDGWGNEELQYYTADSANVRLDGKGSLEIRALRLPAETELKCWYGNCRYTSARLITKGKFQFTYGRAEARIKLPEGAGVWPAFWMLGSDIDRIGWPSCGEIDVMEFIGRESSNIYGTLHGPGYSGANSIGKSTVVPEKPKAGPRFHVFAVEWEPKKIRWYFDGKLYHTVTPRDITAGSRWVFNKPFFLILNFAVGGKWPRSPDASTRFPQSMLVDHVRVTSLDPGKKTI